MKRQKNLSFEKSSKFKYWDQIVTLAFSNLSIKYLDGAEKKNVT